MSNDPIAFCMHSCLSTLESIPILTSTIVSPIHLLISAIECIAAGALFLLAKAYNETSFRSDSSVKFEQNCLAHTIMGAVGAVFAVGNFFTLGFLASQNSYEDFFDKFDIND